jgi:hypothetical protein
MHVGLLYLLCTLLLSTLQKLNNFYPVFTCTQVMAAQIHNFQILSHLFFFPVSAEHLEMLRGAPVWDYLTYTILQGVTKFIYDKRCCNRRGIIVLVTRIALCAADKKKCSGFSSVPPCPVRLRVLPVDLRVAFFVFAAFVGFVYLLLLRQIPCLFPDVLRRPVPRNSPTLKVRFLQASDVRPS